MSGLLLCPLPTLLRCEQRRGEVCQPEAGAESKAAGDFDVHQLAIEVGVVLNAIADVTATGKHADGTGQAGTGKGIGRVCLKCDLLQISKNIGLALNGILDFQ